MNVRRCALFFIVFAMAGLSSASHEQSPKLLIKFPTRERPQKFFKMLDLYYQYLSGTVPVHFLISCDIDDRSMNCPESIENYNSTACSNSTLCPLYSLACALI